MVAGYDRVLMAGAFGGAEKFLPTCSSSVFSGCGDRVGDDGAGVID
jgi:hypothetical protein